uniref:Uncharacterized protein n=1 Tax=Romanomermis culicivorax TaxID=13658 RepID=A0A915JAE3_ROMCU
MLPQHRLNASNMEKINVQANLGSRVVNIKIVKERKCDVDSMGFRHCPISKRTKPPGFPANFGHHEEKTSIPKLKRYSPWSGAFMSQPYSLKWITYFETNQKDVCIGVLVKEYDVTGNGTQDRTSSSLTTATCAKNM